MRKYTLLCLLLLKALVPFAQEDTEKFNKNAAYATVGTLLFYGEVNLTYERFFSRSLMNENGSFYFGGRAALGILESFSFGESATFTPGVVLLFGNNRSHVELGAGVNTFFTLPLEGVFNLQSPLIELGYRFHNMQKSKFIYRVGVGWPKGVYMSAGWSF